MQQATVNPWVLSAFWFGSAFHWLMLLLVLVPANVVQFMGTEHKGTYVGILTVLGAIMALVIPPLVGAHSDRTGRRIPYLRLGVIVDITGLAIMAFAATSLQGTSGFWVYVIGFILVQFGNNYATAPYAALIPQIVPAKLRGQYSGVMGMLQAIGQLLGAVTAILVSMLIHKLGLGQHLQQPATTQIFFYLIGFLILIPTIITINGVTEYDIPVPKEKTEDGSSWVDLFKYKPFLWVFITRVMFALGQYSVQPFMQYYTADVLKQKDPVTSSSVMLFCIIGASILSAFLGGRLSDTIGRKPVIYIAGTVMAAAALALLAVHNFLPALCLAVVFGLGFGAFTSVDWALGSDAMPSAKNYARDMGIWHIAFVGPQFISGPQGYLLDKGNAMSPNFGYTLVFGLAAIFFILGVLLVKNVPEERDFKTSRT